MDAFCPPRACSGRSKKGGVSAQILLERLTPSSARLSWRVLSSQLGRTRCIPLQTTYNHKDIMTSSLHIQS
jgi:hypothetical protein